MARPPSRSQHIRSQLGRYVRRHTRDGHRPNQIARGPRCVRMPLAIGSVLPAHAESDGHSGRFTPEQGRRHQQPRVPENLWLQVRMNGKEGWILAPEDFDALATMARESANVRR